MRLHGASTGLSVSHTVASLVSRVSLGGRASMVCHPCAAYNTERRECTGG